MFTLKDIKGSVVEINGSNDSEVIGYMDGVIAQSSVKLKFNRDKLIASIRRCSEHWAYPIEHNECLTIADAIIAIDKDIVEINI